MTLYDRSIEKYWNEKYANEIFRHEKYFRMQMEDGKYIICMEILWWVNRMVRREELEDRREREKERMRERRKEKFSSLPHSINQIITYSLLPRHSFPSLSLSLSDRRKNHREEERERVISCIEHPKGKSHSSSWVNKLCLLFLHPLFFLSLSSFFLSLPSFSLPENFSSYFLLPHHFLEREHSRTKERARENRKREKE